MKKSSKTVLSILMMIAMIIGLTGCSGEEITLVNKTVKGLSVDVPSDFGEFTEKNQVMIAANEDSTATISLSAAVDAEGVTAEIWDEETYKQKLLSGLTDLQMIEFNNAGTVAGNAAVIAHYTAKNSSNVAIEAYSYLLYYEDGTYQAISFNYNKDKETSLKQNIDAVKNSIKVS